MNQARKARLAVPAVMAATMLAACGGAGDPDAQNVPFHPKSTSAEIQGTVVKGSLAYANINIQALSNTQLTVKGGGTTDQNGGMFVEINSAAGFGINSLYKITVTADANSSMVCDAAMCGDAMMGDDVTGSSISGTELSSLGHVAVPYNASADGVADGHVQVSALSTLATRLIESAIADGRNVSTPALLELVQSEFSAKVLRAIGWQTGKANVFSMPIVSAESADHFITGTECNDVATTDENGEPVLDADGNAVTEEICTDVMLDETSTKMSLLNAAFAQFAPGETQAAQLSAAYTNLLAAFAEEPDALMAFRQPLYDALAANPLVAELGFTAADLIDLELPLADEELAGGPVHEITTATNLASAVITGRGSISDAESPAKAFDGDSDTKWLDNTAIPSEEDPAWIQIDFAEPQAVNSVLITSANDAPARDPENFTLVGSNDGGETWVTLTSVVGASFDDRFQRQEFRFANELSYSSYRLNITKDAGDSELMQLAEIQLLGPVYTSVDHTDNALGTVTARGVIGDAENQDKAFDNDAQTKWLDNTAIPTEEEPTWVQVDFTQPVAVNVLAITSANDAPARDPENFALMASNDGGESWVQLAAWVGETFDDRFQRREFRLTNQLAYGSYRLNISKNSGDSELMQLAEIELIGPQLPSLNHAMSVGAAYSARASIGDAENQDKAFDGDADTKWLDNSAIPTAEEPTWIQVDLAEAKAVNALSLTSANDAPARDPENFELLASNDGGTSWITLGSWVGETFDDRFQTREFNFANNLAYSTYRLNISKNSGDSELMQVAEVGLIGPQYAAVDLSDSAGASYSARASISDGESEGMVFDNNSETKWLDNGGVPSVEEPSWVQVDLAAPRVVSSLAITSANDAPARDPENFELLGSNDGGVTWVTVASWVGESWDDRFQRRSFEFANGFAYSSYRLNITKNSGDTDLMQISEIELIGLDQ
ncbi:discoidin domain-containing protein [Neptunicella marina]|uniref:Discoidin domain-containing protein n=1 Tax=Neptunicella marina TaxID=2125989 RepID=A0A8J6IW50_9ALTE|nr:discoidin domain-containing protein [Neptunicella marina]MBC3766922.1 discoidin domain-containing protein [Neptunicella marina]